MMSMKRRDFILGAGVTGSAVLAAGMARANPVAPGRRWEYSYSGGPLDVDALPPGLPGRDYTPVVIPNGGSLPFRIVDGVKVFHLTVEEIEHEFTPGLKATCWGYGGRVNSTVIEALQGEQIRIYVTNRLATPTTVHWHGLYLPNGMDGVSGISQRAIAPGETFKYEWILRQHGTFMYHSHHDTMTQEGMGLTGMFIVHPRNPGADQRVDRDFALLLNEYRIDPGTSRPNPNEMTDFNLLTINGRAFPGTDALVVGQNQRVRIRLGNLSQMDHHPIHLHGYHFRVTATDGGAIPLSAQWPESAVLVAVGQTRDIEFIADAPGDWIIHCHMTHHIMNQMGHGALNMIGVQPGDLDTHVRELLPGYMTRGQHGMGAMGGMRMPVPTNSVAMASTPLQYGRSSVGGMFTVVKVRTDPGSYDDPGWYEHPPGTRAEIALPDEMERDGIKL